MGPAKGRPKKGQLADMTIPPPPEPVYELPPPDECETHEGGMVLAPMQELRTRFQLWQDRYMVEFAVMQLARVDGRWQEVARIDTCHQAVHHHQLRRGVDDHAGAVTLLEVIPAVNGWEVIDRWYEESLKRMQNDWQEHLRRWNDDRR